MIAVQTVDRVLSGLDALLDEAPDLEPVVDFYEELLPLLLAARPVLNGLAFQPESAQAKLKEGIPLLWGELDGSAGSEPNVELFMTLCRLATEGGNDSGELLMQACLEGKFELRAITVMALTLDRPALTEQARALGADPALLESVARYILSPIVWAYRHAFSQTLDFGRWSKGYCPVCGDWPVLGELRGRDKLRYLRCGRCGAGWKFSRLQCVWCDNTTKKELGFLFDPDSPTRRIDICDYCQGYLKTFITFDPLEAEMLFVHDLGTMGLDQLAVTKGYKRPFKQPLR